jgi:hypothetical protein
MKAAARSLQLQSHEPRWMGPKGRKPGLNKECMMTIFHRGQQGVRELALQPGVADAP